MAYAPVVPAELTQAPFSIDEARRAGLTRRQLRGGSWVRVGHGMYRWAGLAEDPMHLLVAAARRLPPGAAFSGRTAAWLHGLTDVLAHPIEAIIPAESTIAARAGISVHRTDLGPGQTTRRRGLSVTTGLRTVTDLARSAPLVDAVIAADAALHKRLTTTCAITRFAAEHKGRKGIRQLRRVIDLAEPKAESPMETRLRLLLVLAGLPRPEAQVKLHDARGRFLGRVDVYYPAQRLAIEFDGGGHRTSRSLVQDSRRQNGLLAAGYRLLRFTSADVVGRPASVVAEVRAVPLAQ